jgi:hypothetical protein
VLLTVSTQSASARVYGEVPSGLINSVNTVFTTSQDFVPGTETVYYNGVRQREGLSNDYVRSESGGIGTGFDTITLAVAPRDRPGLRPDDVVIVDYDPV